MANVASYNNVELDSVWGNSHYLSTTKYNRIYQHGYHIYEESLNGNLLSDDADLIEKAIENTDELLSELKSDFLVSDSNGRVTQFGNERLKHYRTHFNNLKQGLEEELAKLTGGEVDDHRNAKQTEAIHAQISALKAMKEQIDEQINALSQAL